jgi:hypothetical protein
VVDGVDGAIGSLDEDKDEDEVVSTQVDVPEEGVVSDSTVDEGAVDVSVASVVDSVVDSVEDSSVVEDSDVVDSDSEVVVVVDVSIGVDTSAI